MPDPNDRAVRIAAGKRLARAEHELQAAQRAVQADSSNENRARYWRAREAMTAAQAETAALLQGWGLV